MDDGVKKVGLVLVFVAGFVAVSYALDTYLKNSSKSQASNTLEQLKSQATIKHPDLPPSEAIQKEAIAMASERLDKESDNKKRRSIAAGNFFGFYLINVRERADYCRSKGVDISPFVSAFQANHTKELETARAIVSDENVTEEEIYSTIKLQMKPLVEQDMRDIAQKYSLSIKDACELFVVNGKVIADNMQISKVQPAVYQVLMDD